MRLLLLAGALTALSTSHQAHPARRAEAPVCEVVQHPRDYQGRKFTVATDLAMDLRHVNALLNFRTDACRTLPFRVVPGTQAVAAFNEIEEAMIGVVYASRTHRRAPMTFLRLDGIRVRVTGTMICKNAADQRCEMHITDLFDVAYPSNFPREMQPR